MPLPSSRRAPGVRRRLVAGLLAPLVLASALSVSLVAYAAPASAATTVRTATELTYGRAVLRELNTERRAHHLPALRMDQHLRLSARRHNLTMARFNTMSHQLPGELDFARRISQAGYRWTYAGENIGWNSRMTQAGVVTLQKIMYNEKAPNDGHRRNILSGKFRQVGVDVYLDRKHHKVWLTTDFGRH